MAYGLVILQFYDIVQQHIYTIRQLLTLTYDISTELGAASARPYKTTTPLQHFSEKKYKEIQHTTNLIFLIFVDAVKMTLANIKLIAPITI